jgi:hypothetical protein
MIPDDVRPILTSLLERSRRREVEWLESSAAGHRYGDFVVLFPASSIVLWEDNESPLIEGRVLNNRGDIVVSFDSSDNSDDHETLRELMELARRKVLRADETLAEIHRALEYPGRVGTVSRSKQGKGPSDDDEEVPF